MIAVDVQAQRMIDLALAEDVGAGDWTTLWTVPQGTPVMGRVVAKSAGVVAGTAVAEAVFHRVDPGLEVTVERADGNVVAPDDTVLTVHGEARSILTAERTALNFLQRLSGIATLTRRFVDAIQGTDCRILDTRKTTPGWRSLEKAAVHAGGGQNHRIGLFDMVLIKDNHIAAAGGIAPAIRRVRAHDTQGLEVEVEVASREQLEEALEARADRILLDNMTPAELRVAVRRAHEWAGAADERRPRTEASGNISLDGVRLVAETGVDFISVGALTHSAPALDLSLRVDGL